MIKIFASPLMFTILVGLLMPLPVFAKALDGKLYKNPECTCCEAYADYLKSNGFKIDIITSDELQTVNRKAGVPQALEGCHALFIGGYVVQGHVPVDVIRSLLSKRPNIVGISLPGMPLGVPGMEGSRSEPLSIYEIATIPNAKPKVFATLR